MCIRDRATTYNNFYEFGEDKSDPARNAHTLHTRPWTVEVAGLVKKPQTIDIDTLMKYRPLESRVYRHRCVEAWSMVIPWDGYSMSEFISVSYTHLDAAGDLGVGKVGLDPARGVDEVERLSLIHI